VLGLRDRLSSIVRIDGHGLILPLSDQAAARLAIRRISRPTHIFGTCPLENEPGSTPPWARLAGRRSPRGAGRWRLIAYPIMAMLALALLFGFKAPATTASALPPLAQVRGTPNPSTAAASSPKGTGTFLGAVVEDPYGQVQVKVTLTSGKITDVTAVQLPSQGRSGFISQSVAPILRGEAISTQSASIDTVSGATYTSQAYAQSLQSALDSARA
jgi:uncharacterized protein with FMN-binding domain